MHIEFKNIKQQNSITISGMFGVGKSTIVEKLTKILDARPVFELENKDGNEFQKTLLSFLYSKDYTTFDPVTADKYFLYKRLAMHQKTAKNRFPHILDGCIYQSYAIIKNSKEPSLRNLIETLCNKVTYEIGAPRLCVILDAPWEVIKDRIIKRNRKYEIKNFYENEKLFKSIHQTYVKEMKLCCERFNVPYKVFDANKSLAFVAQDILNYMKNKNIKLHHNRRWAENQAYKYTNSIAVGGMIGAGKSTLSNALSKKYELKLIPELIEDDLWHVTFLKAHYEDKEEYIRPLFQSYIAHYSHKTYKEGNALGKPFIMDRLIFEHIRFARLLNWKENALKDHYKEQWNEICYDMVYNIGLPKLYVILDLKWKDFEKRIFKRGRSSEIENFEKHKNYFKSLWRGYKEELIEIAKKYKIEYLVLPASMSTEEQIKKVMEKWNIQINQMTLGI